MQKGAAAALAKNERAERHLSDPTEDTACRFFFFGKYAVALHDNGWPVIPVKPGTKEPFPASWPKYSEQLPSQKTVNRWLETCADCSIGIVCGRIVAIDIDILDPDLARRFVGLVVGTFGPPPSPASGRRQRRFTYTRPMSRSRRDA